MQFVGAIALVLGVVWLWEKAALLVLLLAIGLATVLYMLKLSSDTQREVENERLRQRQLADEDRLKATKSVFLEKLTIHENTLLKKLQQTLYKDDYGQLVFDRWIAERNYFIDKVLVIECTHLLDVLDRSSIEGVIDDRIIARLHEPLPPEQINIESITALEFEHHCASLLKISGWDAKVTQASGDQGIDIIAKFGALTAVFQCKKYSQPVGNAAVQEVIAGKAFENAHVAAVVSNASYTPAARQLAAAADIHLLHFDELPLFADKLGLIV